MQSSFTDVEGRRRQASIEGMLAVLGALGAPVERAEDVPDALRERRVSLLRRPLEPVTVAWGGTGAVAEIVVPRGLGPVVELTLEGGDAMPLHSRAASDSRQDTKVAGTTYARRRLALPEMPPGYHRLTAEARGVEGSTLVISAPRKCPPIDDRLWGIFLPLYALRSKRNWGAGDLTDLEALIDWTSELGGTTVGTLPLLSAFLDEPFEPSPYSPVSRLFWNELFVDVERVPELDRAPQAQRLLAAHGFRRDVARARRTPFVDYELMASLKRRALAALARSFFAEPGDRGETFHRFLRGRPDVFGYARFRANALRRRAGWGRWPENERAGRLSERDLDPEVVWYHEYVQWVAEEQLARVVRPGPPGSGLYLDLPLGVHPEGYDTWNERGAFALEARAGAPPDMFFTKGQEWGFPPPHPEGIREQGYRYFVACVRNLLRCAGALRIDHVMGLHRMYWVPEGLDATDGVYVRYRPEELYAILALESHRAGAAVIGEDLGTVPRYVRRAMARHGVLRSYVLELEALDPRRPLPDPVPASLASLNTHDTPPFTSFWKGLDVEDRLRQGLLDRQEAADERRTRGVLRAAISRDLRRRGFAPRTAGRASLRADAATRASLRFLAASDARLVVVNLEDLWGEPEPQNRPGTGAEQPNWKLKAARTLEQARVDVRVAGTLEEIHRLRTQDRTRP